MPEARNRPDVPAANLRRPGQKTEEDFLSGERLKALQQQVRDLYLSDDRPWVIGYSGGKDSTATLQLIWYALSKLPVEQRSKKVFVIASDTLVETPVIVGYLDATLKRINESAQQQQMPFQAEKVVPVLQNRFWVNMLGRGYPAPYRRFRWCTDRLKIDPANRFIEDRVDEFGEVVLILGVRRQESTTRAQVMALHRKPGDLLSRHSTLRSAWVYTPIEFFSTNDVWTYLLSAKNPWGNNNRDLVTMYRNAQAGECPLVVDTTTPSCGNSRFGCWTCTVVERDKSMEAMIDSGEEWMEPLLELRDWLADTRDPERKREFREMKRRHGRVDVWERDGEKRIIWGPYKMEVRRKILRMLLEAQNAIRRDGPDPEARLISDEELHEIRRLWVTEEGDWEDSLPGIVEDVTGESLEWAHDDLGAASVLDLAVLTNVCSEHGLNPDLLQSLIDEERKMQGLGRRGQIYKNINRVLSKEWRDEAELTRWLGWNEDSASSPARSSKGAQD